MSQITLDDNLLKELGLDGFSEAEKDKILRGIYEALELSVGMRLASQVGEDALKEFDDLTKAGKNEEAAAWLKQHAPNYQQMASEELDKIKQDIQSTSRKILEKSI